MRKILTRQENWPLLNPIFVAVTTYLWKKINTVYLKVN